MLPLDRQATDVAEERNPSFAGDGIERRLQEWWKELLGVDQIGIDEDFFDLGGHSLIGVQLFSNVKEEFGVDLALATLFEARTIRQIADLIRETRQAETPQEEVSKTLIPVQAQGTEQPIFWIPGGFGTTVLAVRELSELLGQNQPFYGFETPQPNPDDEIEPVPAKAERFVGELRKVQPTGPYRLIGFCGGGFIAWEMAVQLHSAGERVSFLGLVECYDTRYPKTFVAKLCYRAERLIWKSKERLKRGPMAAWAWCWAQAKLSAEYASLFARGRIARLRGKPAPEMPGPPADPLERVKLSLERYYPPKFHGRCDMFVARDNYEYAGLSHGVDPRLAWRTFCEGGGIAVIPGDHEEILKAPNVHHFATALKASLKESLAH